ncbi:hypothetical protein K449DRAFT_469730 [Hypoxylon sp. EC38]|nr:hypothetical protein K449DRAFT_469730 [Hypoxylon sp. EC38]
MGFVRKFLVVIGVIAAIPVLLIVFLVARTQYRLVKSTHTINNIPKHDPVFSSPAYKEHFGGRTWANIDSFACGIVLPLPAIRLKLLENDRTFADEVFKIMWNARMNTQFNGPPSSQPPKVGDVSASDSIRAEVTEVNPTQMAMTITTVSNGFTGGLEVIETAINRKNAVAGVRVKYLWHNDVILPRKWYQYLSVWLQLTGRRLWLMDVLGSITATTNSDSDGLNQEYKNATAKDEL